LQWKYHGEIPPEYFFDDNIDLLTTNLDDIVLPFSSLNDQQAMDPFVDILLNPMCPEAHTQPSLATHATGEQHATPMPSLATHATREQHATPMPSLATHAIREQHVTPTPSLATHATREQHVTRMPSLATHSTEEQHVSPVPSLATHTIPLTQPPSLLVITQDPPNTNQPSASSFQTDLTSPIRQLPPWSNQPIQTIISNPL